MAAHFFQFVNLIAMAGWIILIGFPGWKNTPRGILNGIILVLCLFYFSILIDWVHKGGQGGFDTLANVMLLFTNEKAVLAGWIHYLAFDLFVGLWIAQDALKIGFPRWALILIQLFTFMVGPIGLGVYMIARRRRTKEFITSL
jgi:Domain of unknown function (DUF4281)